MQIFPRRHIQRQRQQIASTAHVEGVFGQTPDVALHDHQVLRGVTRRLGVVGAVAHPDLVHPDMRRLRHVARLARQQQEYAHRFAIGFRRATGAIALRGAGLGADADGGQRPETAPPPPERDRVVDRTAAGIQHDGGAAELTAARELIEIPRAIRGHDADRADPAPAIRLACDPAEPHRQLAFFERDAGMRRTTRCRHQAGQHDAQGGRADQRPAANRN